ncbi:MAG TPA: hypothetical protein VL025_07080 [Thermoanaerobaculia bacterium]|nr:hypothetical protein [Thermoanaerobaculia bacterium]
MAIATDIRRNDPANRVAGKHVTYFEEPDIIYLKFNGEVSNDDGFELLRRQLGYAEGRPRIFFLIDGENLEKIAPDARKAVAESLKEIPLHGMCVFAAPLKAKVITKLIITAVNLFRKDSSLNQVAFFDTEQEARDWIAARRQVTANGK